jgi:hypothetical protein
MGLLDIFRPRAQGPSSAPDIRPTPKPSSQRTFDIEASKITLAPMYGIRQPQDLEAYRRYYLNHWFARRAVDSLVRLTVSDITTRSEDEDLDRKVLEFNRRIGLKRILNNMVAQLFGYGAAYAEIVFDAWPDPSDILGIHCVDSRSMRIDLYPTGEVRSFIQLPATVGVLTQHHGPIYVPPDTMLYLSNSPLGDSPYGHSALQAIVAELKSSQAIELAMVKAAIKAVTGQDVLTYQAAEGETQDEAQDAMDAMIEQYNKAEPGDPLFAAAMGDWKRQTPGQTNPTKMSVEWETVVGAAISGCGLTPDAMGIGVGASLHEAAEQRIVLLSMIQTVQEQICEQLNTKLYRVLADVWNSPEIYVQMAAPILLSEKERAEKETISLNNIGLKAKMGFVNGQMAAQEAGYDQLADEDRFDQWLDGSPNPETAVNPNDPNQQQQTSKALKQDATPANANRPEEERNATTHA